MDKFENQQDHVSSPARSFLPVSTSDSVDLTVISKALYIGVGGDLTVIGADDTTSTLFKAVPDGSVLPIRVKRILTTGTTATQIVSLR